MNKVHPFHSIKWINSKPHTKKVIIDQLYIEGGMMLDIL